MAALVIAAAAVLGVLADQNFPTLSASNGTRVTAPGATEITLAEPGPYTISYEHHTEGSVGRSVDVNGQRPSIPSEVSSMQLEVVSIATGAPVSTHAFPGSFSDSFGNTEGVAIAQFSIDRPGTYSLISRYLNGQSQPQVVLAVFRYSRADEDTRFVVNFLAVLGR